MFLKLDCFKTENKIKQKNKNNNKNNKLKEKLKMTHICHVLVYCNYGALKAFRDQPHKDGNISDDINNDKLDFILTL